MYVDCRCFGLCIESSGRQLTFHGGHYSRGLGTSSSSSENFTSHAGMKLFYDTESKSFELRQPDNQTANFILPPVKQRAIKPPI